MTRRSKREIERLLDDLDPDGDGDGEDDGPDVGIAHRDPRNGDLYDDDGTLLPPEPTRT